MTTSKLASALGAFMVTCLALGQAQASTVTFEDQPAGHCAPIGLHPVSGGFTFSSATLANPTNLFACDAHVDGNNTSRAILGNAASGPEAVSMTFGANPFSILSFDAGSRTAPNRNDVKNQFSSNAILVTGFLAGGGTVTEQFDFTGTSFGHWTLDADFSDVIKVTFTGIGDATFTQPNFLLDNIETGPATSLPEPATLALVSLALAGIGLSRRKAT